MELYLGNNVNAPNGYKKRTSFKNFEVWTKLISNGREHYFDANIDNSLYMVFGDYINLGGVITRLRFVEKHT